MFKVIFVLLILSCILGTSTYVSSFVNTNSTTQTPITNNTSTVPNTTSISEESIMNAINDYRKTLNLTQLSKYDPLCDLAKIRAYEIREDWSHNGFENRGTKGDSSLFDRFCNKGNISCTNMGENLAKDYKTVEGVLNGWKNSPKHNENMIGDYNVQCVAVIDGYVSSLFAKTTSAPVYNNVNSNNQIIQYNFESVKSWEKSLNSYKSAKKSWEGGLDNSWYDRDKVIKLLDYLTQIIDIEYKIWDGQTNSKLTWSQFEVLKAKDEDLNNRINGKIKDIYQGAYKKCVDFYDNMEDTFDKDYSKNRDDCKDYLK